MNRVKCPQCGKGCGYCVRKPLRPINGQPWSEEEDDLIAWPAWARKEPDGN